MSKRTRDRQTERNAIAQRELDERESRLAIAETEADFERMLAEREIAFERAQTGLKQTRQTADLTAFIQRRINEEQAAKTIAPQFVDYIVAANSPAEVEAAIELAKTKTAEILAEVAGQRQARDAQGRYAGQVSDAGHQQPEADLTDLSLTDYVRLRGNPGMPGSINSEGIFS